MSDNKGPGNYGMAHGRSSTMADYDALPPVIRKFYQDCPYNYGVSGTIDFLAAYGVEKTLSEAKKRLAFAVKMAVIDSYGPDHPQAQ